MSDNSIDWKHGVTIGIPLYNEELFIEDSIRSAVSQCQFLIVSDNYSDDRSFEICERLASEFNNLVLCRQPTNIGAVANFEFVMNQSQTPYFMWLGAHDLIPSGYVKCLRQTLESDSSALLAYGSAKHINRVAEFAYIYEYFFSNHMANNAAKIRFQSIIRYLSDCSLIHGLFYADRLKSGWLGAEYLGGDQVQLSRLAILGKFLYTTETYLLRRDVHLNDSPKKRLNRITGSKQLPIQALSLYEMQRSQYALALNEFEYVGIFSWFFILNVRFWLVVRFGPFSDVKIIYFFEMLVYLISRPIGLFFKLWRKVKRQLRSDKR